MSGHHHGPPAAAAESHEAPAGVVAPKVSSFRLLATLFIAGAMAGIAVVIVYQLTLPAIKKYAGAKIEARCAKCCAPPPSGTRCISSATS